MLPDDYWIRSVLRAAWFDWRSHPRLATTFGVLIAVLSFLAGYVVVPPEDASIPGRVVAGLLGVGLLAAALCALFCLWAVVFVPIRQRDSARADIAKLRSELDERDRLEFSLTPAVERFDSSIQVGQRTFTNLWTLWVEVENLGRVADFVARIPSSQIPVTRYEDGHRPETVQVYNIAWEQTLDWRNTLGVARLRLAAVTSAPKPMFWFWTARNATFNPDAHGIGWRLVPHNETITFPLIVSNITDRKSITKLCHVRFQRDGQPAFQLSDT